MNQRGLEAILERIRATPSPTLVNRYLSLIAELPDESERTRRALDLADLIAADDPTQALSIAHQVFKADRMNVRALDVMIAAMTAKGRFAKAEVLKVERDKLVQAGRGPAAMEGPGYEVQAPRAAGNGRVQDAGPGSRRPVKAAFEGPPPGKREVEAPAVGRRNDAIIPSFRVEEDSSEGEGRTSVSVVPPQVFVPPQQQQLQKLQQSPASPFESSELSMLFEIDRQDRPGAPLAPQAAQPSRPLERSPIEPLDLYRPPPDFGKIAEPVQAELTSIAVMTPDGMDASQRPSEEDVPSLDLSDSLPWRNPEQDLGPLARAALQGFDAAAIPQQQGTGQQKVEGFVYQTSPRHLAPTELVLENMAASTPQIAPVIARGPAPEVPHSSLLGVAELFDHYWRQGFVQEARDLLLQTAGVAAHEAWWQARHAQLLRTKNSDANKLKVPQPQLKPQVQFQAEPQAQGTQAPRAKAVSLKPGPELLPAGPMAAEAFWQPLYAEMNRLAQSGLRKTPAPTVAAANAQAMPPSLLKTLSSLDGSKIGLDGRRLRSLFWDLMQGLWGAAPSGEAAQVIEALGFTRLDPGFWGLYVDSLISAGRHRKALVECMRALSVQPHLPWARSIFARLPRIWRGLGVDGFAWNEDEGVQALRSKLSLRPRARFANMIAARAS